MTRQRWKVDLYLPAWEERRRDTRTVREISCCWHILPISPIYQTCSPHAKINYASTLTQSERERPMEKKGRYFRGLWSHRWNDFACVYAVVRRWITRLRIRRSPRISRRNFVRNILRCQPGCIRYMYVLRLSLSISLSLCLSSPPVVRFLPSSSILPQPIWLIFSTLNGVEPINPGIRRRRKGATRFNPF